MPSLRISKWQCDDRRMSMLIASWLAWYTKIWPLFPFKLPPWPKIMKISPYMEEVKKFSRWKNFQNFFCSKWAKKPKKQHVFFKIHLGGVGWVGQTHRWRNPPIFFLKPPLNLESGCQNTADKFLLDIDKFIALTKTKLCFK